PDDRPPGRHRSPRPHRARHRRPHPHHRPARHRPARPTPRGDHPMTDPTPYTDDDDLTPLRWVEGVVYPFRYEVIHRLVATVDSLRAERDAARADRVCWRETHNQVAAERDALRGMVRRYHAGWYIVSASAPLRDV